MIASLLVGTLAVIWAWEALRVISPWSLPAWVQPLIVLAIAAAITWPDWRLSMAAAGAAGVVNALVRESGSSGPEVVRLRAGIGQRIPALP